MAINPVNHRAAPAPFSAEDVTEDIARDRASVEVSFGRVDAGLLQIERRLAAIERALVLLGQPPVDEDNPLL